MKNTFRFYLILFTLLVIPSAGLAQTNEFTYQGKLNDGANPANANYDFEFVLFTATGAQIALTNARNNVAVAGGVFSVTLDFGAGFPGADRFLEIRVRPAGVGSFTTLAPRQKVNSAPYSIRSQSAAAADTATNSSQLGGVAASQFVQTTDPRLTDARPPTAGSANYVQNTSLQQAAANFNVSGTGTANILNAATQYNIGGNRVLSASAFNDNTFLGINAGANTTGISNSFFGRDAGLANTSGQLNSFFGTAAGEDNTTGEVNSFFGQSAGRNNTTASSNSFFGQAAGLANTTGGFNSFFGQAAGRANTSGQFNSFFGGATGYANTTGDFNSFFGQGAGEDNTTGVSNAYFGQWAGRDNTTGNGNSFFGRQAGDSNTTGDGNSFFGVSAGDDNTTGSDNTIIGHNADVGSGNLSFATAIGSGAQVTCSDCMVLGRITANTNVGIGTTAPVARLHVSNGTDAEPGDGGYIVSGSTTSLNVVIDDNEIMARNAGAVAPLAINADGGNVNLIQSGTGNVGIGTSAPADKLDVDGDIRVGTGTAGCVKDSNGTVLVGACSSDLRFKRSVTPFSSVLGNLTKLQPVHFYWRADEFKDKHFGTLQSYGLIAQEVEAVFPELVTTDEQGYRVVNYSKLPLLTIKAITEQQQQIEFQQKIIEKLEQRLAALERKQRRKVGR